MTTDSFLAETSVPEGDFPEQFMLVRYRGFEDGGSDKVPAVPEVSSLLLTGLGVLATGLVVRRRRK